MWELRWLRRACKPSWRRGKRGLPGKIGRYEREDLIGGGAEVRV
jgi:hypothetical protein